MKTNLDIRDEMTIKDDKRHMLTNLHKIAVALSDQAEALLFAEYMIQHVCEDYQISNSATWGIVNELLGYCYDFEEITGDESFSRTANDIFDGYYRNQATNHETLERAKALADKLATETIHAWAKF